ncbi:MAG TPA: hypothetical protein VMN38_11735 [Sphingomicrobium sp.]|nr:hypothetical protein [Sphingomicrobium sp.]
MSNDIDTRISPTLHPARLKHVVGDDNATAGVLTSTETALRGAYEALRAIHNAREAAKTNPAWTEGQQIIATADFADNQRERVSKALDAARGELVTGADDLERELAAPITSKAAATISTEIRAHVKGLKGQARIDFIRKAIVGGDDVTATAVLGTVPFLSGVDPKMHAAFTRMYHEHNAPGKAARLKAMRGAVDVIDDNWSVFLLNELEKAVGAPWGKVSALRAAKTKAEEAFILKQPG